MIKTRVYFKSNEKECFLYQNANGSFYWDGWDTTFRNMDKAINSMRENGAKILCKLFKTR